MKLMNMEPSLSKCLENPSEKDEVWDKCVRRSSVGIGLGTIVGAVSSIFFGTGSVIFSISMCATWAVKHCRALFREQEELKRKAEEQLKEEMCRIKETPKVCDVPEVKEETQPECEKPVEEPPCPLFPFQPIIPIPDRPFGRFDEIDECNKDECECNFEDHEQDFSIQCKCPKPDNDDDKIKNFYLECKDADKTCGDTKAKGDSEQNTEEDICTCQQDTEITPFQPSPPEPECGCTFHADACLPKPTSPPPPVPDDEECTCEPRCTCSDE